MAALKGLEARLRTRLEGGLVVELAAPDAGVRERVIARDLHARLGAPDQALATYLASRPAESVRAAQGLVQRVLTTAEERQVSTDRRARPGDSRGARPGGSDGCQAQAGSLERHRRSLRQRRAESGEDDLGVARGRRPAGRGLALMAIKGSLKEASLPDVIQLLFLGRRTGCLALADRHNFGTIHFDEGHIIYATIVNRRDRLGDILVRNGRVTAEALQQAIERQDGDREHKVGEILVELGALTRQELESYMRMQIEEAVYYLFTWTSGTFNFEAGVAPEQEDFLVRINPEFLLLEGARRVDEWSLIEKKIPSFDLIFAVDQARVAESAPEPVG